MRASSLIYGLAVLAIFAAGCQRDSVKVYHVESEDISNSPPPAAAVSTPAMDASALPPAIENADAVEFATPAGWEKKAPSNLRVASLGISENGKSADVSVIPLGGMAGGEAANVTRWRGQVGLPPVSDEDLPKISEPVEIAGQAGKLFDIAGTSPGSGNAERILAVILNRSDATWFFKMTGDADLVEKQKPAFLSFLKSFQFTASATASSPSDLGQLPSGHPAISGMNSGGTSADAGEKPTWTIPAGWQEGPLEQFLIAKFIIAGAADAKAEVNVSALAGDGGGLLPNVNRWRGQLGLPSALDSDLSRQTLALDSPSGKIQVMDFSGTNAATGKRARLVGAILPLDGQTWFYKLMGDETIVAAQKDAFLKFVQSAKYPNVH